MLPPQATDRYRILSFFSYFEVQRQDVSYDYSPPCFTWVDLDSYGSSRKQVPGGFGHAARYASFTEAKQALESFRSPVMGMVVYEDKLSTD